MNDDPVRLLLVAGEASGDLHGGNLARELKELIPNLVLEGSGGKKMRQAGVSTLFDIEQMGAVGVFELIGSLFHHWKIYQTFSSSISKGKYDAAVLINYPGLNLRLARKCKAQGVPVFFFISPQVWAWERGRIKAIRKTGKKIFVLLPFEESIYREAGVDVEFQGHPFIDIVPPDKSKKEALKGLGLDPALKTIGILPGSRKMEVEKLFDTMLEASVKIKKEFPLCQFVIPVADTIDPEAILEKLGSNPLNIKVVHQKAYEVMYCSDFLIIASGSATLEAGILACPMVIVYKVGALTYSLFRHVVNVEHFGLVNIVAGKRIVPELLNQEASPDNIAREALRVLKDPAHQDRVKKDLLEVRRSLGRPGVVQRIASSICKSLNLSVGTPNEETSV